MLITSEASALALEPAAGGMTSYIFHCVVGLHRQLSFNSTTIQNSNSANNHHDKPATLVSHELTKFIQLVSVTAVTV